MIYLDNNATMDVYPQVISAVGDCLANTANIGSPHGRGRAGRAKVEQARERVASLVHAASRQVLFVSGATEGNNMALMGGTESLALVSSIEHACVLHTNMNTETIPVDKDGIVDVAWLDTRLQSESAGTVVVSVMSASHEVGTIQPLRDVARITAKHCQRLHVDAVQGAGKIPLDFQTLGVQSMCISPHKFGGVQGIAGLIYDSALGLKPLLYGGGQQDGIRPGTINMAGAVGFGVACDICENTMPEKTARLRALTAYMENEITAHIPNAIIVGAKQPRLAGISRIIIPNLPSQKQVMMMDLRGFCISEGSACSSGVLRGSSALQTMGYGQGYADCSVRIGMSWKTTQQDIESFTQAYIDMVQSNGTPV